MQSQQGANDTKYFTIQQLSTTTGFSVTQVRRLVRAGKIPFFQPGGKGGKLLFPPDALESMSENDSTSISTESEESLPGPQPRWMTD